MDPTSDFTANLISNVYATRSLARLVSAVQELSLARSLDKIMEIVRRAARELTGADGATFVLRESELCHYAEENAIGPLWKGRRFPIKSCISGWAMLNRQPAVIEDIYMDERIPLDAYRPTFVRSLVMVPIRTKNPIGAIGNYWGKKHLATPDEVMLLQALADSTSFAMENVSLYADLERRVQERTAELEAANKELETFSHTVSHDLRAPLRAVRGFSQALKEQIYDKIDADGKECIDRVLAAGLRMDRLIDDLLNLSHIAHKELILQNVSLSKMVEAVAAELQHLEPERNALFMIADNVLVKGDWGLLDLVVRNLMNNAWKFSSKRAQTVIEFGLAPSHPETFFIRDNGAGFDMAYAGKLFAVFQRLHRASDFEGTGVGLATVQRIIQRHKGKIWAESTPEQGATFFVTVPGLTSQP